jgi:hypothetical protein
MRRSIDDHPMPPGDVPTEEVGRHGAGLVAHLRPASARRLRVALRDALRELGEDPGS